MINNIKFGKLTHPIRNLVTEINKASKMGFDYVELGIEPLNDYNYFRKNKNKIKKILKRFNHNVIGHTAWWYDLSSPYEVVRKAWIKQAEEDIKIANELEIKLLNFHFLVPSSVLLKNKGSREVILNNYVKSLNEISKFAHDKNIVLMFENGEEKFEFYKYVLERVPDIKVHFDVGHAFISGGTQTIRKFISYFGDRIAHIHIHDNHGKQDEHLALRKGKINWKKVVSLLKKSRYDKTITFEVFKSDKDLLSSREYFKKLWQSI